MALNFSVLNNFQKKNLSIMVLLLLLIIPALWLAGESQEIRKKAAGNKPETLVNLSPIESKTTAFSGNAKANTVVSLDGEKLKVTFKKGTIEKNNLQRNVVAKLLPVISDKQIVRFSLNLEGQQGAGGANDGNLLAQSLPPTERFYELSYNLSDLRDIYAYSSLSFTYLNPSTNVWENIPTTIDGKNGVILAKVNHFSDFGITGVKAQVFAPTIKSWETSLYTGSVSYSYPISAMPGEGGMAPSFGLSYNSMRANSLFDEQKGSWVGAGWDMPIPEIRFDSYETSGETNCAGMSGTRSEGPQYTMILGGTEEPLIWIKDVAETAFFITKSSNMEVKATYGAYKGKTAYGSSCRNKIISSWLVKDTKGGQYIFWAPENLVPNRKLYLDNHIYLPVKYLLKEAVDVNGNKIEYEYQVPAWEKEGEHIYASYPSKVWYNDRKTMLQFFVVQKQVFSIRGGEDKNFEKSRLTRIEVLSDATKNPPIINKTYRFIYFPKETYKFDTLKKIVVYGPGSAPTDSIDPNGDTLVKNRLVPSEFSYELMPVGIQQEVLISNIGTQGDCRTANPPLRVADWDQLKDKWSDLIPDLQRKLEEAGFKNCTNRNLPGVNGCPISAENYFYTSTVQSGDYDLEKDCVKKEDPENPGHSYYLCSCKKHESQVQGSILAWEKNKAPFLTKAVNGYGGEIYFTYENKHRGKDFLNRNVVISKKVSDANFKTKGSPDVVINYQYHPILEDGKGMALNKGGGFGRVTQTDPVTGVSNTTFFYPLAPREGDGSIQIDQDPFFGNPLRTVVHKIEGNNDKIYSDSYYTYSFIPPYSPNLGVEETSLNIDVKRSGWSGWKLVDNFMAEGAGKKITTVTDSFSPKSASFVTIPYNALKPQYIPNEIRKANFLHSQSRSYLDKYGYGIKSINLGEVDDSGNNGFNISEANADVSLARSSTQLISGNDRTYYWWLNANTFTFGLPMQPVLFTTTSKEMVKNGFCKGGGHLSDPAHCSTRDVCCNDSGQGHFIGGNCNIYVCEKETTPSVSCNSTKANQCLSFGSNRTQIVNEAPFSGQAGALKKYAYTKYDRSSAFLTKNMSGLTVSSFVSDLDIPIDNYINPSFEASLSNKYKLSSISYNEKGMPVKTTVTDTSANRETGTPATITSTVAYDEVGNVLSNTDARGQTSYIDYYAGTDKPYDKILPEKQRQSFVSNGQTTNMETRVVYDDNWQPIKNIDPNGVEAKISYDCLGRLKETFKPDPVTGLVADTAVPSTSYYYFDYAAEGCGLGAVTGNNPLPHLRTKVRISSSGSDNEYLFSDQIADGLGNSHQSITHKTKINGVNKGLVAETIYNNRGLKEKESMPVEIEPITTDGVLPLPAYIPMTNALWNTYEYDELGKNTLVTDPMGQQAKTEYFGMMTKVTDANNVGKTNPVSSYAVADGFGRNIYSYTTNIVNGAKTVGIKSYSYFDVLDNVVKAEQKECTDPSCPVNGTENLLLQAETKYDHLGRKWQIKDPDLGIWKFAYDAGGNITEQTDAKNQKIVFTYDDLNRLVKKTYPDGIFIQNIYDKDGDNMMIGKRFRMLDTTGYTQSWYDKRGRVVKDKKVVNLAISGGTGEETAETTYKYFDSDALKSTILPTGEEITQKINEVGQLIGVAGQQEYLKSSEPPLYNKFGSMVKARLGNGLQSASYYDLLGRVERICVATDCDNNTNKLMDYQYQARDKVGNILGIKNEVAGDSAFNLNYTYDSLYQLTSAAGKYNASYAYDLLGRMLSKIEGDSQVAMKFTDPDHKHAPKEVNGVTYIYDANGNLVKDELRDYLWNFDNKPVKITMRASGVVTEFAYDGDGNRVLKKVTGETPVVTPTPTAIPTTGPVTPTVTPTPTSQKIKTGWNVISQANANDVPSAVCQMSSQRVGLWQVQVYQYGGGAVQIGLPVIINCVK